MSRLAALPVLLAALLFGASTPLAKLLVGGLPPLLLAGLLYLGSGLGLGVVLAIRAWHARGGGAHPRLDRIAIARRDWPSLAGAIVAGGVLAPALLMLGLARTEAAPAALLLNLEGVFTAVIAWVVLRENTDRHIVAGMAAIVAGGGLLSWQPGGAAFSPGALLVVGACLCWAVDNTLTRQVAANDAMLVACLKGLLAGVFNTALALAAGGVAAPSPPIVLASLLTGFLGYGLSLTLFVVGLRTLGAARTGAYFAVAPLLGVIVSLAIWPALPGALFWLAAALMALGVWLHLLERHDHVHTHAPLEHSHRHRHDAHHRHAHAFAWDGEEPHTHPHRHVPLTHMHAHFPDIHHRHAHTPHDEDR